MIHRTQCPVSRERVVILNPAPSRVRDLTTVDETDEVEGAYLAVSGNAILLPVSMVSSAARSFAPASPPFRMTRLSDEDRARRRKLLRISRPFDSHFGKDFTSF